MNLIFSKTLFLLLLLVPCYTESALIGRDNILSRSNEITTIIPHGMTEVITAPEQTSEIRINSESNHTEMALLVVRKSLKFSPADICGGILVSTRIVITAAHCIYDPHGLYRRFPNMFSVAYGRSGVYRNVAREGSSAALVVAHPNYNENERINDIGAIRLEECMRAGSVVIARQLLPLAQAWNDEAKLEMLVFWIENEVQQIVKSERKAARWTSKYKCQENYHRWGVHISPKHLCIESVDHEFYHRGESAILLLNGQPIGVLSFKFDVTSRANSLPFIYTELSRYPEFIQKEIHTGAAQRLEPYRICSSILYVVISMGVVK